jgi:hypothetical protein
VVSGKRQRSLAQGPPHRRGDHEGTLEHARGQGKPELRPFP